MSNAKWCLLVPLLKLQQLPWLSLSHCTAIYITAVRILNHFFTLMITNQAIVLLLDIVCSQSFILNHSLASFVELKIETFRAIRDLI
jgi:hypothetical protein